MLLWDISSIPEIKIRDAGTSLDWVLDRELHALGVATMATLQDEDALKICRTASRTITDVFGVADISEAVLRKTVARASQYLSVREAWVYRDWQAAIGDIMLSELMENVRRYQVIGYRRFEQMCQSGSDEERIWLSRLHDAIDELDVHADQGKDARIGQLREVYKRLSRIVIALDGGDLRNSRISRATLDEAKRVAG